MLLNVLELRLDDVEKEYQTAKAEFEKVKSNYSGFLKRFRINLNKRDDEILAHCMRVSCLSYAPCVQEQLNLSSNVDFTLYSKIQKLCINVLDFPKKFRNYNGIDWKRSFGL